MKTTNKIIKCAIYTRKSTDEGLDKEFNTLEAQRDAGINYVKSQVHQGWEVIAKRYDDGGFSGGNMNRPALRQLIEDIKSGEIDMIVVYKIDRLTRSLTDFSKMVEVFDEYGVSFVSVTQNFNTYDSMGRLTLNVLLSFAQFEREVSGERIRDKLQASKRKGMWVGGPVPLGYDVVEKKLVINHKEAEIVKMVFEKYLSCKSPQYLVDLLNAQGFRTKAKITQKGKTIGGNLFNRAHIYRILDSQIYLGKIHCRGEYFNGQHEAIISQDIWDKVHKLKDINPENKAKINQTFTFKTLKGLLFCGCCDCRMVPTKAKKRGKEYHYYTSLKAVKKSYRFCEVKSIPALDLENYVVKRLKNLLQDPLLIHTTITKTKEMDNSVDENNIIKSFQSGSLIDNMDAEIRLLLFNEMIEKIVIWPDKIKIILKPTFNGLVSKSLLDNKVWHYDKQNNCYESIEEVCFLKRRNKTEIYVGENNGELNQDRQMIVALVRAFGWQHKLDSGRFNITELSQLEQLDRGYMGKIIKLTTLAPDIIESILAGLQPKELSLIKLIRSPIPVCWQEQRQKYGFTK